MYKTRIKEKWWFSQCGITWLVCRKQLNTSGVTLNEPKTLHQTPMTCFMLERGVRIPALMSWVSVSCRGSDTRAPRSVSLWECAVSSSLGRTLFCSRVFCCVARSSCFYRLRAFMLYLVLFISLAACFHVVMSVNTWLMSFLISCVCMSCFVYGWWFVCWPCACVFVLCEHVAFVLVFCVPCALMSICLDPTHLVTC